MSEENIGQVHITVNVEGEIEVETNFPGPHLNLLLDKVKTMLINGEFSSERS